MPFIQLVPGKINPVRPMSEPCSRDATITVPDCVRNTRSPSPNRANFPKNYTTVQFPP